MKQTAKPIRRISKNGKEIIIIGSAHTSKQSAELIRKTIKSERPDVVCVELCSSRYDLKTNTYKTFNKGVFQKMLLSIAASAYGGDRPGIDMSTAIFTAQSIKSRVELIDKDIDATTQNLLKSMAPIDKVVLLLMYAATVLLNFKLPPDDTEEIIRQACEDSSSSDIGRKGIDRVLLHDRNEYMAMRINGIDAEKILAVVGAGHLNGIAELLSKGE